MATVNDTTQTRQTFVVGRLDRRTTEVQLVAHDEQAPFPGPWSLKAVVRDRRPGLRIVR